MDSNEARLPLCCPRLQPPPVALWEVTRLHVRAWCFTKPPDRSRPSSAPSSSQPGLRWSVGRALLLTLRYTGLRLKEVVSLRTEEDDLDARRISLVGKGRKPRVVPIPHVLEEVLRENLDGVRPRLPVSNYLFANPRGKASLRGRRATGQAVEVVVDPETAAVLLV